MDPAFLTIAELGRLYDQRELSPVEVTRSLLDRIAAHDAKLHSFIRVTPEAALAEAQAAERELMAERRRGPLHGIPYALKDIVETAGSPTTGHSRLCKVQKRAVVDGRGMRRGHAMLQRPEGATVDEVASQRLDARFGLQPSGGDQMLYRSSLDSPLEGTGFEPSVPRKAPGVLV